MIIIPAIDIINGRAVRLYQGNYHKVEVVGENILDIAECFKKEGAKYIHLVDLDGAKQGKIINKEIINKIVQCIKVPIEVGGGIRTYDQIRELIENGVSRVILGTAALDNEELLINSVRDFKEKIAVGIDCKKGYLCGNGWVENSGIHYIDFIKKMEEKGVENIIVTDIDKDGTLDGVNIDFIKQVKNITTMRITASGGIKDIRDIVQLKEIGIYGAITGKAIYNGNLNLKEAIEICKE